MLVFLDGSFGEEFCSPLRQLATEKCLSGRRTIADEFDAMRAPRDIAGCSSFFRPLRRVPLDLLILRATLLTGHVFGD
jgi:hypothetical protein